MAISLGSLIATFHYDQSVNVIVVVTAAMAIALTVAGSRQNVRA
jgi:hypothetical protein